MKKIVIFLVLLSFCTSLFSCRKTTVVSTSDESAETYLIFGVDEAADNTDVLMLVTADAKNDSLSVIQIPRDTYYAFGSCQNKINQVYAKDRANGFTQKESAERLVTALESAFGIPICGFIGITTENFRNIVDKLGGIALDLPEDYIYQDGTEEGTIYIPKGKNILDGKTAEKFVRFRKAYKRGDLGRLDAQKLFMSSLMKTAKNADVLTLLSVASMMQNQVITNISIIDSAKKYLSNRELIDSAKMTYSTLPGEAMLSDTGLSYYILNKNGCVDILEKNIHCDVSFDPECRFFNVNDNKMVNIYFDKNADKTEYSDDTLGDVRIVSNVE